MRISREPNYHIANSQNQKSKDSTQHAPFALGNRTTNNNNDGGEARPDTEPALQPVVAMAVQNTLARLHETGSVFDVKDTRVMNSREASVADRQRYTEIVVDASKNNGFSNAKGYVAALSADDQAVLMRINSLAMLSGVTDTNEEGALNLLLPDSEHVDINNDSLVNIGKATLFKFPPLNAPDAVKQAWEEATKHLNGGDAMMAQAMFFTEMISANIQLDSRGNATSITQPSDPNYVNIFPSTDEGWREFIDEKANATREAAKSFPNLIKEAALMERLALILSQTMLEMS